MQLGTYFVTDHAIARWQERFGDQSMVAAYNRSFPFGAQKRAKLQLDEETGAVFVLKDGVVKTILTKEMAVANQQVVFGRACRDLAPPVGFDARAAAVESLAKKHVEKHGVTIQGSSVRLDTVGYKPLLRELREIVPLEDITYEKYLAIYYRTITNMGKKILSKETSE